MIVAASLNRENQCVSLAESVSIVVFEFENVHTVSTIETINVDQHPKCNSSFAPTLAEFNVEILFTNKIGDGAKYIMHSYGIKVIVDCNADVTSVITNYFEENKA